MLFTEDKKTTMSTKERGCEKHLLPNASSPLLAKRKKENKEARERDDGVDGDDDA